MGKKRISYHYILLIFLLLISRNCTKNKINKIEALNRKQNSFLLFLNSYLLEKNSLLNYTFDFISENDSVFYFSNPFARGIFNTQRPFDKYEQIGRNGNGPFEYLTPFKLYIFKDKIYYSDINNALLKFIYLKEKLHKYTDRTSYLIKSAKKFIVKENIFYTFNSFSNPRLNLYSKKNGELLDSLIILPKIYNIINRKIEGGNIVEDDQGNLYLSCVSPYIIFKIINKDNKLFIKEKWNFENEDEIIPWDEEKNKIIKRVKNNKNMWDILHSVTRLRDLKIISGKNNEYLIVYLTNGKTKESETNIYHIINLKGKIIKKYISKSLRLIGVIRNKIFFIKNDVAGQNYSIEEYVLNE